MYIKKGCEKQGVCNKRLLRKLWWCLVIGFLVLLVLEVGNKYEKLIAERKVVQEESVNVIEDNIDFFGKGIEDILANLTNVYGVNVDMGGSIENKIDVLYENRIYYGVDYRLKLIQCINYNNMQGTGKDYSEELNNILTEIRKMYNRELDKVITKIEVTESTTELTTTETTTLIPADTTADSLTDFINGLSESVDTSTELDTNEFYEIWYENDDGTYYKTTERYDSE